MNFERTCAGYGDFRVGPSQQYCERCGEVTETVWRRTKSRHGVRYGRHTRIAGSLCDRRQRVLRAAHYWERPEKRDGQIRLW